MKSLCSEILFSVVEELAAYPLSAGYRPAEPCHRPASEHGIIGRCEGEQGAVARARNSPRGGARLPDRAPLPAHRYRAGKPEMHVLEPAHGPDDQPGPRSPRATAALQLRSESQPDGTGGPTDIRIRESSMPGRPVRAILHRRRSGPDLVSA